MRRIALLVLLAACPCRLQTSFAELPLEPVSNGRLVLTLPERCLATLLAP